MASPTDDHDAAPGAAPGAALSGSPLAEQPELADVREVLTERQRSLTLDLQRVLADLQEVRDARGGQSDDDEHDPEGATMSSQWSHAMGIRADLEARLSEVDRALLRLEEGTYGFCVRCGDPIPGARLAARPSADRCVRCATPPPADPDPLPPQF